jgi:hypothetical protein
MGPLAVPGRRGRRGQHHCETSYPPGKVAVVEAYLKGGSTVRGWCPSSAAAFTGAGRRTVVDDDGGGDLQREEDVGKGETQRRGLKESSQRCSPKKTAAVTRTRGLPAQRGSSGWPGWTLGGGEVGARGLHRKEAGGKGGGSDGRRAL